MTRSELLSRWLHRADEFRQYGVMVDGARLISALVSDLEVVFREEEAEVLTLAEAARISGYSVDHLGRLLRAGALANAGSKHRPRVRRGDLPCKPSGKLHAEPSGDIVRLTSKRQIARSVVNSEHGRHDG